MVFIALRLEWCFFEICVSRFYQLEVLDEANQEGVAPDMALQTVYLALLEITDVADSYERLSYRKIQR